MRRLALGLISGTSQDGIDAALAAFDEDRFVGLVATHSGRYPQPLRQRLIALSHEDQTVSLAELAALDRRVAECFAEAVLTLLRHAAVPASAVSLIGSHGQTVFHDPAAAGNTLQLGDPSRIAALTGIQTVADFRRKDIALGGQGAPLVPAFHHALFAQPGEARAVLNIGGIGNLTLLPGVRAEQVRGFDTGPGNALMDEWTERNLGQDFDRDGVWAAGGTLLSGLLLRWLDDPYLRKPAPKSTGRGHFRLGWAERLGGDLRSFAAADVQRTLCELTARSIADALLQQMPDVQRLLVCGGGARNGFLMQRLRALLPACIVQTTDVYGLDPDWVEAAAFAWLGIRRLLALPGNLAGVTGACRQTVLGGLFPP